MLTTDTELSNQPGFVYYTSLHDPHTHGHIHTCTINVSIFHVHIYAHWSSCMYTNKYSCIMVTASHKRRYIVDDWGYKAKITESKTPPEDFLNVSSDRAIYKVCTTIPT